MRNLFIEIEKNEKGQKLCFGPVTRFIKNTKKHEITHGINAYALFLVLKKRGNNEFSHNNFYAISGRKLFQCQNYCRSITRQNMVGICLILQLYFKGNNS